jgi:antitoxin (DNA-binding transcriptional repressor) of toxin-antitoxin stability system
MVSLKAARTPLPVQRSNSRARVGVRELRQNLSVYLARVIEGERFDVTDHGLVVAMLSPTPPATTLVERLVAEGRAIPATRDGRGLPPLRGKVPADLGRRLQRALQESREDRL